MKKFLVLVLSLSFFMTIPVQTHAAEGENPYGTSVVDPAGPNEAIFTISKGAKNKRFTAAQLLALKSRTISVYEPFIKKRQSFTVIPIESFFKLVGIKGKDKVNTKALNDYEYSNSADKFIEAQAFIAIKRGGKNIGYDQGGPIRLIFPDSSTLSKTLEAWNWSLISIAVR